MASRLQAGIFFVHPGGHSLVLTAHSLICSPVNCRIEVSLCLEKTPVMEIVFIATMMEAAIMVLLLAIVFVAAQAYRGRQAGMALVRRKPQPGHIEAQAIILSIEQTGLYMNHHPQVRMQVQVMPDKGRNFVTEVKQVVTFLQLGQIRTGATIKVKYNPTNTKEITLIGG